MSSLSENEIGEGHEHAEGDLPLVEPEIVNNLLLDGVMLIRNSVGGMRCVGWSAIYDADGHMVEKRIVLRFTLAADAVARVLGDVRRLFSETIGH